ncbi:MAG: HD domain-containing phosphohydrolase [Candidatus Omnitrophota bacterium]
MFGNSILVINDDEAISKYLREELTVKGKYIVTINAGSAAGIEDFKKNGFAVILVKFGMRDMPGAEIVRRLQAVDPDCVVIALIEHLDQNVLMELARLGIYDFITKPINLDKLFFLIKKAVDLHSLVVIHKRLMQGLKEQNVALQKQNVLLAKRIEESTRNLTRLYEDLRSTYMHTIKVLAHAIDARDHYTHSHSENVAKFAVIVAEEMHLPVEQIEMIREACELHDLGKIGVEDNILSKPSALNEKEWENIRRHPMIGAQILEPLTFLGGVIDLVKQHHERYDGKGYPQGLKGEEILLGARIINLVDAYEAMRSARSYRKEPFTKEQAVEEIKKNSGTQFDPKVVEAFMKVVHLFP